MWYPKFRNCHYSFFFLFLFLIDGKSFLGHGICETETHNLCLQVKDFFFFWIRYDKTKIKLLMFGIKVLSLLAMFNIAPQFLIFSL